MTSCQKIAGTKGGIPCPTSNSDTTGERGGLPASSLLHSLRSNTAEAAEWEELQGEGDPELYAAGVSQWALRQEEAGRVSLAAEAYSTLLRPSTASAPSRNNFRGISPKPSPEVDPTPVGKGGLESLYIESVRRRLEVLQGRGSFGSWTEFRLRDFAQQAADPAQLFAMAAAGMAFRLTQIGVLSRLASGTKLGSISPFLGHSLWASLAGFAVEAPTFTVAAQLGNTLLGRGAGGSDLGRELASSYLVLGALKLAGWAGGEAYRGLAASGSEQRAWRGLCQQSGMLAGILLGHRAEQAAGLRPQQDGATALTDSLATLLQFHVGGNLAKRAFGPGFQALERKIDLQTEVLRRDFADSNSLSWVLSPATDSSISSNYLLNKKHSDDPAGPRPGEELPRDTIRDGTQSPFATDPKSGDSVSQNESKEAVSRSLDELAPEEQWIRAYLNGELNSEEGQALERRLRSDPEFKEEFLQMQLLDYLDGALNAEQKDAFERELAANPWLQAYKRGIEGLDKLVDYLVPREPSREEAPTSRVQGEPESRPEPTLIVRDRHRRNLGNILPDPEPNADYPSEEGGPKPPEELLKTRRALLASEAETSQALPVVRESVPPEPASGTRLTQRLVPAIFDQRKTLRSPSTLLRHRADRLLGPKPPAEEARGFWQRAWREIPFWNRMETTWRALRNRFGLGTPPAPLVELPARSWIPRLPFFTWSEARGSYVFRLPPGIDRLRLNEEHFDIRRAEVAVRETVVIRWEGGRWYLDMMGADRGVLLRSRVLKPGDPIELGPGVRFLFGGREESQPR